MRMHDYLRRVGIDGPLVASIDDLRRLHVAHREAILFENLTIQSGCPISVELADIERKFLDERRGGYCFEHNTLFAAALADIGFAVTPFLGRVRRGPPERWARTHMVLKVEAAREAGPALLADVGFGATGLIEPIPLVDGATAAQRGLTYTLRKEGVHWILAMRDATQAMDLYEFAEEPQTIGDVVVANHYTSTYPESIFVKTLTIQRIRGNDRFVLRNDTLSVWRNGVLEETVVERSQLPAVARDLFGVDLLTSSAL